MFSTVSYDRSPCYSLMMVKQIILAASMPTLLMSPMTYLVGFLATFALLTPIMDQNEIPLKSSCNKEACCKYVDNGKRALDTGLLV